jgi:hypothetical protein
MSATSGEKQFDVREYHKQAIVVETFVGSVAFAGLAVLIQVTNPNRFPNFDAVVVFLALSSVLCLGASLGSLYLATGLVPKSDILDACSRLGFLFGMGTVMLAITLMVSWFTPNGAGLVIFVELGIYGLVLSLLVFHVIQSWRHKIPPTTPK